ncbi:hypothetical protein IU433_01220 [Nocardia puris]|uniref:Excreted virulence factor EspC (Type VII ESX diderm) n=2 Tax=Nocardia puris TaxID=208602 RepID=A0A366DUR1_9NOCA|nr:hypothetical protein [Nocardia puris]MBF6367480.1 hypothetical protein [Nocardia puris]MBF6457665.1 hypothetical protein [Nocardia puris]RBO93830.1 excreted virulence factor EspC (type VII ESX diderm) [Nocardia puris]
MAMAEVNVDPERAREHAKRVETISEGLAQALEAAAYLAQADDGYGLLVRPYAQSILNPKHEDIVAGLRHYSAAVAALPQKLRQAADVFEEQDAARKGALDKQRAQIGGAA